MRSAWCLDLSLTEGPSVFSSVHTHVDAIPALAETFTVAMWHGMGLNVMTNLIALTLDELFIAGVAVLTVAILLDLLNWAGTGSFCGPSAVGRTSLRPW